MSRSSSSGAARRTDPIQMSRSLTSGPIMAASSSPLSSSLTYGSTSSYSGRPRKAPVPFSPSSQPTSTAPGKRRSSASTSAVRSGKAASGLGLLGVDAVSRSVPTVGAAGGEWASKGAGGAQERGRQGPTSSNLGVALGRANFAQGRRASVSADTSAYVPRDDEDPLTGEVLPHKGTGRKEGVLYECEMCHKVYRHPSCLNKHRWEHTTHWKEASKLLLSKHQQVQLLEAAAILITTSPVTGGSSLPEEKSFWPAAVSPASSGLLGSQSLNIETTLAARGSPRWGESPLPTLFEGAGKSASGGTDTTSEMDDDDPFDFEDGDETEGSSSLSSSETRQKEEDSAGMMITEDLFEMDLGDAAPAPAPPLPQYVGGAPFATTAMGPPKLPKMGGFRPRNTDDHMVLG